MSPPPMPKRRKLDCCREWERLSTTERAMWRWQVIHQFAHSRTTFMAATLAASARIEPAEADELIARAQQLKWIWPPIEGVWVGQLAARR